jgi:hypothetical protein
MGHERHGSGGGAVVLHPDLQPSGDGLVELTLGLTDGATGARVDDLAIHDDALVHLAVVGPGGSLWHVHPVRTAPGRFAVRLPLSDPGRYGVFAELARDGGGHQVARSAVRAGRPADDGIASGRRGNPRRGRDAGRRHRGHARRGPGLPGGAGVLRERRARARPAVLAGHGWPPAGARPSAGATDPDPADPATSFAHLHFTDPPVQYGYGPRVAFSYAFPAGGRYQLWAQVQRGWQLVTIPITG